MEVPMLRPILVLVPLLAAGCVPTLVPCDPLAGDAEPISLGTITGAGRSADGTVYVVDQDGDDRVFVGEDGVLVRWRVLGSGEGNDGDIEVHEYSAALDSREITVCVEIAHGTTTMAVIEGEFEGRIADLGKKGEILTLVSEAEVRTMPVRNLPGDVAIEYYAEVEDGSKLLVTRPVDDWDYEDFRVFFGTPEPLVEREVGEVLRATDGGSTTIRFRVDGTDYLADFPIESSSGKFERGSATLDVGPEVLAMDWLDADATITASLQFQCFE
jgi:hypothetical protein